MSLLSYETFAQESVRFQRQSFEVARSKSQLFKLESHITSISFKIPDNQSLMGLTIETPDERFDIKPEDRKSVV